MNTATSKRTFMKAPATHTENKELRIGVGHWGFGYKRRKGHVSFKDSCVLRAGVPQCLEKLDGTVKRSGIQANVKQHGMA